MQNKKGLGRGLNALIPGTSTLRSTDNYIEEIEIDKIQPNKDQPRKTFNEDSLHQLKESIQAHGLVQPIVVNKDHEYYQIVAGERRWRAAKLAGLTRIPCVIKNYSDETVAKIALVENLQREDLNDIEEAIAYQTLIEKFNLTQDRISEAVGKSRSHIANTMRLLKLDHHVRDMVVHGKISGGHARALLRIDNAEKQKEMAERIHLHGLSVRDIENYVSKKAPVKKKTEKKQTGNKHELQAIEERLRDLLSTKVEIKHHKNKGTIEIEYYSEDELNRIVQLLL